MHKESPDPATGTVEASAGEALLLHGGHRSRLTELLRATHALPGRGWRPADQGAQGNAGTIAEWRRMGAAKIITADGGEMTVVRDVGTVA